MKLSSGNVCHLLGKLVDHKACHSLCFFLLGTQEKVPTSSNLYPGCHTAQQNPNIFACTILIFSNDSAVFMDMPINTRTLSSSQQQSRKLTFFIGKYFSALSWFKQARYSWKGKASHIITHIYCSVKLQLFSESLNEKKKNPQCNNH